jgi:hypothetical protein
MAPAWTINPVLVFEPSLCLFHASFISNSWWRKGKRKRRVLGWPWTQWDLLNEIIWDDLCEVLLW